MLNTWASMVIMEMIESECILDIFQRLNQDDLVTIACRG